MHFIKFVVTDNKLTGFDLHREEGVERFNSLEFLPTEENLIVYDLYSIVHLLKDSLDGDYVLRDFNTCLSNANIEDKYVYKDGDNLLHVFNSALLERRL